jgi:peroxiredoxin/RNA polymerase subunit RPABC4/transcription elongation factor Spt4
MPEAESQTGPRSCRQCGAVVPEGTAVCPRCGKRWYMDRVEQQGVELWQKILEKRSAAGQGEAEVKEPKKYHCPNCMAILKGPVSVCPHCGNSTVKAKIVPQDRDSDDIEKSKGGTEGSPNMPESARGLASIKGASKRAGKLRLRKRLKTLDIIIICAIVVIIAGMCFLLARQYGFSYLFPISKPAKPAQALTVTPAKPVISDISISDITIDGAAVGWSTDIPAYGKLLYGTSAAYGAESQVDNISASHSITLSGLQPASAYHFAVLATDANGKELSRSEDTAFNTLTPPNTKPPVVSQFNVLPTDVSAIVTWTTDKPATSQVLYGLDKSASNSTPEDSKLVTSHTVRISGLQPNSTYYYRIKSVDADGNAATMDPPDVFITPITVPVGPVIGDRAPDFTVNIFNTQDSISLRTYKGQKVLVAFWSVSCPECDRELSLLQTLNNKNMPGVNIIAVFIDSKPEDIENTISQYKSQNGELTVPICVDMYKTAAHVYNVEKVPCTFFIDGDLIVRDIEYSNFNSDQIEQILSGL